MKMTPWQLVRTWLHLFFVGVRRRMVLGARVVVFDGDKVLMIRHTYSPGWHFPGGGVELGETAETAVVRELAEETGVFVEGRPRLHGLFAHFKSFPGDHIALFVIDKWTRPVIPAPNREIVEQDFFPLDALPEGTGAGVRERLLEVKEGAPPAGHWV